MKKYRMSVHKFTSCDGCQLSFINMGSKMLEVLKHFEILHFAETGYLAPHTKVDIAFIEGSISTQDEIKRIKEIRTNSNYLISIGACATSGGIQALRNYHSCQQWVQDIYAKPETIQALDNSSPISAYVKVDLELWGCPVSEQQVTSVLASFIHRVKPLIDRESVCMECKRQGHVCIVVTKKRPCMGPVTKTGCGALCPGAQRECYACFGPVKPLNVKGHKTLLSQLGLSKNQIERRYQFINPDCDEYNE